MIIALAYTKIDSTKWLAHLCKTVQWLQAHVFCLNTEVMTKWVLTNYCINSSIVCYVKATAKTYAKAAHFTSLRCDNQN